jgi:hypothetical protein
MHEILSALSGVMVVVFFVAFLGYNFFWGDRFTKRLMGLYKAIWLELGSPDLNSFPSSRALSSRMKLVSYVRRCEYRSLGDEELNRLGDRTRALYYLSEAGIVIFLLSQAAMLILHLLGDR